MLPHEPIIAVRYNIMLLFWHFIVMHYRKIHLHYYIIMALYQI